MKFLKFTLRGLSICIFIICIILLYYISQMAFKTNNFNNNISPKIAYPFMAFISATRNNTSITCSGTMVKENFVLTAGHCLFNFSIIKVKIGINNPMDPNISKNLEPKNLTIHENYNPDTLDNDIGLIELDEHASNNIKIVNIYFKWFGVINVNVTTPLIKSWVSNNPEDDLSDILLNKYVSIIDNMHCNYLYEKKDITYDISKICIKSANQSSICHGDSGAPLFFNDIQIGLISGGGANCNKSLPLVSTNIVYYWSWIQERTEKVEKVEKIHNIFPIEEYTVNHDFN